MPIGNVAIKPQILYRKKLHTVYSMMYKPTLTNRKKLNLINYKHETHPLAYTFEAGSWQI